MPRTGVWVMAGRHVASAMVILAAGDEDANMKDALPPFRPGIQGAPAKVFRTLPSDATFELAPQFLRYLGCRR